jgi:hypothetical protein
MKQKKKFRLTVTLDVFNCKDNNESLRNRVINSNI